MRCPFLPEIRYLLKSAPHALGVDLTWTYCFENPCVQALDSVAVLGYDEPIAMCVSDGCASP